MRNIGVVYGGKSVEHDISIITALQVMKNLRGVNVVPLYIDGSGRWWTGKKLLNIESYSSHKIEDIEISFALGSGGVFQIKKPRKRINIDCAILCCHGLNCEDGSVAGLMEMANIPYTACGILSSAIGMDKAYAKMIFEGNNIYTPEFGVVYKENPSFSSIVRLIGFPLIVKPANLGSSVGISVCKNKRDLRDSLEVAFEFDKKVIIEKYIDGCREFNCACFSYDGKIIPSKVMEVDKGEIYSFDQKYVSEKNKKAKKISPHLKKDIQHLATRVYSKLECFGVVRVDFLYDEKEDCLYVNEVNTIPGSLAFYLYPQKFSELLEMWIEEGIARYKNKENFVYSYNSDALKVFKKVSSMRKYTK